MLKNLKLGAKIVSGFAIVLVLLFVVAFVGYSGLSGIVDRVDMTNDANHLMKLMLETRQHEKDFRISGDEKYVDTVEKQIEDLKQQATKTKDKFNDQTNRLRMDDLVMTSGKYQKGFADYVDMHGKLKAADANMVKAANDLVSVADTIQKNQMQDLTQAKAESDAQTDDNMTKADDANYIIKWALECRQHEKDYIIRRDDKYIGEVKSRVEDIIALAEDLKSRFNEEENKAQADQIIAYAQKYKAAFDEYAITTAREDENKMLQAARKLVDMADIVRENQKQELAQVKAESDAVIDEKMIKARDADNIIKWTLQCGRHEKSYILYGDRK